MAGNQKQKDFNYLSLTDIYIYILLFAYYNLWVKVSKKTDKKC